MDDAEIGSPPEYRAGATAPPRTNTQSELACPPDPDMSGRTMPPAYVLFPLSAAEVA